MAFPALFICKAFSTLLECCHDVNVPGTTRYSTSRDQLAELAPRLYFRSMLASPLSILTYFVSFEPLAEVSTVFIELSPLVESEMAEHSVKSVQLQANSI